MRLLSELSFSSNTRWRPFSCSLTPFFLPQICPMYGKPVEAARQSVEAARPSRAECEFEVEKILDHRWIQEKRVKVRGRVKPTVDVKQYRVRWAGYVLTALSPASVILSHSWRSRDVSAGRYSDEQVATRAIGRIGWAVSSVSRRPPISSLGCSPCYAAQLRALRLGQVQFLSPRANPHRPIRNFCIAVRQTRLLTCPHPQVRVGG
jgi:hypothetical protein